MVFPRALEQLHATIVRDNSAAAYSMLCRFQGAYNNREGLLSYYDWDPQMLIEYPYIDAMALFDRERLINIGGYDTELYKYGWFGWGRLRLMAANCAGRTQGELSPERSLSLSAS